MWNTRNSPIRPSCRGIVPRITNIQLAKRAYVLEQTQWMLPLTGATLRHPRSCFYTRRQSQQTPTPTRRSDGRTKTMEKK